MDYFEKLNCDMTIRNMAEGTKTQYQSTISDLAKFYSGKDLAMLTEDEVQRYIYWQTQMNFASSYVCSKVSALRFFFEKTLKRDLRRFIIPCPKKDKSLPVLL